MDNYKLTQCTETQNLRILTLDHNGVEFHCGVWGDNAQMITDEVVRAKESLRAFAQKHWETEMANG